MVMESAAVDDAIISVDHINAGIPEAKPDNVYLHEGFLSNEEQMQELGSAREILMRVDLDLACCSEKLVNLDILLMHVAAKESDVEALTIENGNITADFVEKALEFDIFSGILDCEVSELDNFMDTLQTEIVDARHKVSSCERLGETSIEMAEKLHDSQESLKQSQDLVFEMKVQSAKFQRALLAFSGHENWNNGKSADISENDQVLSINSKLKMQTAEQQRHILRMLEKSLARELDLEKKLSESRQCEEELNLKLCSSEQEFFDMEEGAEVILGRFFEAENAAEALMGISKELIGRLQIIQFNLNSSIRREGEVRSKLEEFTKHLKAKESSLQKLESSSPELQNVLLEQTTSLKASLMEAEEKYILVHSEAFTLREKVNSLEEQLRKSNSQLQHAKSSVESSQEQHDVYYSEFIEMENAIELLKETISEAESRAEDAEAKCKLLTETNLELNEELDFLKDNDDVMEKVNFLQKQLRESDFQLQQAKASTEASQEQQNMLYSAIGDMENLVNDLKSKVSKTECMTEIAEEKCILLTETNLELNEELKFLRDRVECLQTSLRQGNDAETAMAKDVSKTTKLIMGLLMQLSMERERLERQIRSLTKDNNILVKKLWKIKDASESFSYSGKRDDKVFLFPKNYLSSSKSSEEAVTESSAASFQVDNLSKDAPICETEVGPSLFASKLETTRTEAWQLNLKF